MWKTSTFNPGGIFERSQSTDINGVNGTFILDLGNGTGDSRVRGLMQTATITSLRTLIATAKTSVGTTGTLTDNHGTTYDDMRMARFNQGATRRGPGKYSMHFSATFKKAGY